MKRFLVITAVLLAGVLLGCQKADLENGQTGGISLSLVPEGEFVKSAENVDVNSFFVNIYKGNTVFKSFANYSEVPSTIDMAPGKYRMEAGSPNKSKAAFNQPVYYGSQEIIVEPAEITPVNLVCGLINVKVTIKCTETFLAAINDDFEVVVANGTDANLRFNKSHIDNNESGYFLEASTLTFTLNGTKKENGAEVTHTIVVDKIKARDHIVITFEMEAPVTTGELVMTNGGIFIDYKVNPKEESVLIPGVGEDNGGGDNGGDDDNGGGDDNETYPPLITGDGINAPVYFTLAEANANPVVDVLLKTQKGKSIKDVWVKIDSPTLTDEFLSGMALGGSEFSIVNFSDDEKDQTRKSALESLGLIDPSKPIAGASETTFSIGGFMGMLISIATPGDQHKFIITVIDSDNISATATCTVIRSN